MAISDWLRRKYPINAWPGSAPAVQHSRSSDFVNFLTRADEFLRCGPYRTEYQTEEDDATSLEGLFQVSEFTSLHLAYLMLRIASEQNIPLGSVCHFWRIGAKGGGDRKLANLLERLGKLATSFTIQDALAILDSGAVGNRTEIGPLRPPFNNVSSVIKLLRVTASLTDWDEQLAAK
jgi:hypothetical protein